LSERSPFPGTAFHDFPQISMSSCAALNITPNVSSEQSDSLDSEAWILRPPTEDAWLTRVEGEIDGLPVNVIGRDALLRNKASTGRPKDRIDLEELQKHTNRN
jgi:hypothetical protein